MKAARSSSTFAWFWLAQFSLLLLVGSSAWTVPQLPSCHGASAKNRLRVPRNPILRYNIPFSSSSAAREKKSVRWRTILDSNIERRESLESVAPGTHLASGQKDTSRLCGIRCRNMAGFLGGVPGDSSTEIRIDFEPAEQSQRQSAHRLVVVTGESGAGKSLLLRRSLELLSGGKVAPGLVAPATRTAPNEPAVMSVEMELVLREPQLSAARFAAAQLGLDPSLVPIDGRLTVERLVQYAAPPAPSTAAPRRLKSLCRINRQTVTLKALEGVVKPLLALVDAATAAQALAKPEARLAMLDTAVPSPCRQRAQAAQRRYRSARHRREQLEAELRDRVLPSSFSNANSEHDLELLSHWVDELDAFEQRVQRLCLSLVAPESSRSSSYLTSLEQSLADTAWSEHAKTSSSPQASLLWERLTAYRSAVANMEKQLAAARASLAIMGSLSSTQSAVTTVERARDMLVDATNSGRADPTEMPPPVLRASERAHDLLNVIEELIAEFVACVDDENRGLIRLLEVEFGSGASSKDELDAILLEWGTLSRKHGIAASLLPFCHAALRSELDGSVEAQTLLPQAKEEEAMALAEFEDACAALSQQRLVVARRLSEAVTSLLPSLGIDQALFNVDVNPQARKCTDTASYAGTANSGRDSVDFVLDQSLATASLGATGAQRGPVHAVASSGEKARLLLSIECALPGSVGASCATFLSAADGSTLYDSIPPVTVLYDEIDAHVGGHAAVALARMLVEQSAAGSQVIAITHNPSVAASGDLHLVIKRQNLDGESSVASATRVSVDAIVGAERRKELARMASGDLAAKEAEIFAEALIRDGLKRRVQ